MFTTSPQTLLSTLPLAIATEKMVSVITFDLFITLIILISMVPILTLLYFLNRYIKRHRALQHPLHSLEAGQDIRREQLSRRFSHQQIQVENGSDEQPRVSSVRQSLELLPQIRTSDEKAEEWLERGKSNDRVNVGEVDLGAPKTYQMLGVKRDGEVLWDWKSETVKNSKEMSKKGHALHKA